MLLPIETLLNFAIASALLCLIPGPGNLYVLGQSSLHGKKSGMVIILGQSFSLLFHTAAVAFGVAALLQASVTAFTVLKIIGAGYLGYLAWKTWRAKCHGHGPSELPEVSMRKCFFGGILINLSNPNVLLFFLTYFPQFVITENGNVMEQIFLLGGVFILVSAIMFSIIAILAGKLSKWLKESQRAQKTLNRSSAAFFVAMAASLLGSQV